MARPRNEELRERIARVAARQFAERGYDETSYTTIAEECGVSRNLVQYHWPKKDQLAIAYMQTVLDGCMRELGYADRDLTDDVEKVCRLGTRFFKTLLAGTGTRTFLRDVLASRDLTEGVLAFNIAWAIEHLRVSPAADMDAVTRVAIVRMGGFYELLYWCLKNDRPMDVDAELSAVVHAFADAARGA